MDVSKIDIKFIEIFDSCYTYARESFGVEPCNASEKKQKKTRKWIEINYIGDENFPQEVMDFIGKDVSNEDFFEFLKECHKQFMLYSANKKQLLEKNTENFSDDVKSAIRTLLQNFYDDNKNFHCDNISKVGNDALIDMEYGVGYNRTLTLINASGIPKEKFDYLYFGHGMFYKQGNEYILTGETEKCEEDTFTPFTLRFTDAKVDISLFKANEQMFYDNPWQHLQYVAVEILDKYSLFGDHLNDREKELLPLVAEISKLTYYSYMPDEFMNGDFSHLKAYIRKFGYDKLLPLIEKLEKEFFNYEKKYKIIKKLISRLNAKKYEPLWREIYNNLSESQTDYPSKTDTLCPPALLNETRSNIQKLMETHGYSGKYPDFVKSGAIPGVRLADSYGMTYFVSFEKNVMYHIHCNEEYFDNHITVQFICGTEMLRKNETAGDIYSCLFNAKGRSFFQTVSYESGYTTDEGEHIEDDLEKIVQIAVKKSQLLPLTKEERIEIYGSDTSDWGLFFSMFAIFGGLFGTCMTLFFMLFEVIACLVCAQPQLIPDLFADTPWRIIFSLLWISSGGAMGIVTVLAKRK